MPRLAMLASLIVAASSADALVEVRCEVRDAVNGRPVQTADVQVTVNPPPRSAVIEGQEYVYKQEEVGQSVRTVEVQVSADGGYTPRRLALRRLGPVDQFQRRVKLWVVPEEADLSYKALAVFRRRLEGGEAERALAIFEAAAARLENRYGQYGVHVRYNLARSLGEACRLHGYETCEAASAICASLLEEWTERPGYRMIFRKEGLTSSALERCQRDARSTLVLAQAEEIKRSYRAGGRELLNAAEGWVMIVNAPPAEAEVWAGLGWPRGAAARDAGTAYVRYAEHLYREQEIEPLEVVRQLTSGREMLSQAVALGVRDTTTLESLDYAEARLQDIAAEYAVDEAVPAAGPPD